MIESAADSPRFQRAVVLVLTAAVSVLFLVMIRDFLAPLFLAAVFSGLAWPLHRRMVVWLRGRTTLAAGCTLLVVVLIGLIGIGMRSAKRAQNGDTAAAALMPKIGMASGITGFLIILVAVFAFH